MNEETKHIESCRAEDPLAQTMEACGNESNLQAALQPLLVETMQGYEPVATTAPTSPIAELPGVLISIIRRVATKPLTILGERPAKQSLLGTLLDTWNAIRNRLSGNPSLGIPDRRADMSGHSLPTALALLNDRKISDLGDCPDGISFLRMMCSDNQDITKLKDDNYGWVMTKPLDCSRFNLSELEIGCGEIVSEKSVVTNYNGDTLTIHAKKLAGRDGNAVSSTFGGSFRVLNMPDLEEIFMHYAALLATYSDDFLVKTVEEILIPKLGSIKNDWRNDIGFIYYASNAITPSDVKLRRVVLGKLTYIWNNTVLIQSNLTWNLIDLEIGAGTDISLKFDWWLATNALDASRTDLIEQGSTAENNLQQFLLNFKTYIALRLANRTGLSKLTLTLSANVFSAVFTNESGSTEEIVARNAIRDEIRGEITDRNWKVTDSTNNFNN